MVGDLYIGVHGGMGSRVCTISLKVTRSVNRISDEIVQNGGCSLIG